MQPAFFSLVLIAVHVSVPVDCTASLRDPERLLQHQQGGSSTGARAESSAGTGRFYLELSGSMRKGIHRHFLGKFADIHQNYLIQSKLDISIHKYKSQK